MTLPSASPDHLGLDSDRLHRLERWLQLQVEQNRVAGASVLVARHGSVALFKAAGKAQLGPAHGKEQLFARDTLTRLYSMTKPVTTVAAMMLHEQGHFQLDDPIAWYLPAFAETPVWTGTAPPADTLDVDALFRHVEPQQQPVTVRHLMTHTSGLTYSFMNATPVDQYYRDNDLVFPGSSSTLAELVDRLAKAPLLCQPGTRWNYSVATDVLGRLVEIWSGLPLDEFFSRHIFSPLKMPDTGFHVPDDQHHRLADLMGPAGGGDLGRIGGAATGTQWLAGSGGPSTMSAHARGTILDPPALLEPGSASVFGCAPTLFSGGGGLVGSIDDFARFAQMLLNAGELDGVRLLSRKSVQFMRKNQLPGNVDMAAMGQAVWSETSYEGIGFGLGFAVVLDPVKAQMITSPGEHHWGGAASTFFWIDPAEDLFVVFLTQLYPSSTYPLRRELRTVVYQALVDHE
ncbi:MAG: beta-lactamase family protein [Granulosicoccus sp.]|nr:beta-lactamase family protein [Granulosicoccus sp.]